MKMHREHFQHWKWLSHKGLILPAHLFLVSDVAVYPEKNNDLFNCHIYILNNHVIVARISNLDLLKTF